MRERSMWLGANWRWIEASATSHDTGFPTSAQIVAFLARQDQSEREGTLQQSDRAETLYTIWTLLTEGEYRAQYIRLVCCVAGVAG